MAPDWNGAGPFSSPLPFSPYLRFALPAAARLLSSLDRNPGSPTYGSFDRTHWAWAGKDFANADLQRGVLALTHFYLNDWPDNHYFSQESIREWIQAGLAYWAAIQCRNGSFNQWFPNEFSYGTTAFTAGPLVEATELMAGKLTDELEERLNKAFDRSARFLLEGAEGHGFISNHQAGAALSLYRLGKRLSRADAVNRCWDIIARIEAAQSEEGWFSEYGGADPGYETLGIYYLAELFLQSNESRLLNILKLSIHFLKYFIHPNGTLGGEYGSRNTELFYPAGFEMLADQLSDAEDIAAFMRPRLDNGRQTTPLSSDSQNFVPLLTNYLTAAVHAKPIPEAKDLPCQEPNSWTKVYPDAGLAAIKRKDYYAVCGFSKGGSLRIHASSDGALIYCLAGYQAKVKGGLRGSTQFFTRRPVIKRNKDCFEMEVGFFESNEKRMTPLNFLALRLFNLVSGRLYFFVELMKKVLSGRLIARRTPLDRTLIKSISFSERTIEAKDMLGRGWLPGDQLKPVGKFSSVFMGSANYFSDQELLDAGRGLFAVDSREMIISSIKWDFND